MVSKLCKRICGKLYYYKRTLLEKAFRFKPVCSLNRLSREEQVIVSVTSFPGRLDTLDICLRSLLRQTMMPDRVVVSFGSDVTEHMLPSKLKRMEKYGVEFRYYRENIKPHKKYYYIMQESPDCIIVTVDDDCIYPKTTIEELYSSYKKHPTAVSGRRVHRIVFEEDGSIAPYKKWEKEVTDSLLPSNELVAIGVGGVLYPPHILPPETFNMEAIVNCALCADDLWLKAMEIYASVKVVWAQCSQPEPSVILKTQKVRLNKHNTGEESGNDCALQKILKFANVTESDFREAL